LNVSVLFSVEGKDQTEVSDEEGDFSRHESGSEGIELVVEGVRVIEYHVKLLLEVFGQGGEPDEKVFAVGHVVDEKVGEGKCAEGGEGGRGEEVAGVGSVDHAQGADVEFDEGGEAEVAEHVEFEVVEGESLDI
jgi:hypothetical protein